MGRFLAVICSVLLIVGLANVATNAQVAATGRTTIDVPGYLEVPAYVAIVDVGTLDRKPEAPKNVKVCREVSLTKIGCAACNTFGVKVTAKGGEGRKVVKAVAKVKTVAAAPIKAAGRVGKGAVGAVGKAAKAPAKIVGRLFRRRG